MKRKLGLGLVFLLLLVLLVTGTGFTKVTGGGWFYDTIIIVEDGELDVTITENRISVAFNGKPLDGEILVGGYILTNAKGQLQLIDHATGDRIHCKIVATNETGKPEASFYAGPATLNGEDGYFLGVEFHNDVDYGQIGAGDFVSVSLRDESGLIVIKSYAGFLVGGTAHQYD